MSENIQKNIDILNSAIKLLEQAIPYIMTPAQHEQAITFINQACDHLQTSTLSSVFKSMSTTIRILNNGESAILKTVTYQGFILEVIEAMYQINSEIKQKGVPQSFDQFSNLLVAGEFLIRIAGRVTTRYKLKVTFEQEYEAKSIRAFMVLKEVQSFVRFLSVTPDLVTNQSPNLDNGLEIDLLSLESPQVLHKLTSSVLEVVNVQLFTETKSAPVMILDPPSSKNSYDEQMNQFLNK